MRVGFIGLGSQGAPMAHRIIEEGHDVVLWARRRQTLAPFADSTAAVADSLVELGAQCDVVRDIDLGRGRIRVERSTSKVNSKTVIGTTKTHAARSVAVSASVLKLLAPAMVGKAPMSCCGAAQMGSRRGPRRRRIGSARPSNAARPQTRSSLA